MDMSQKEETSGRFEQMRFLLPRSGASERLARIFPWLDGGQDWTETEADWSERCSGSLKKKNPEADPNGLSTRMVKECCRAISDGILPRFKLKWGGSGTMYNGVFSTQKTSASRKTGKESKGGLGD